MCLLGLLLPMACKDRLDVQPLEQLTSADFFTTPEDAVRGTNAIYNTLRLNTFNDGLFPIFDIMSDDARPGSDPTDQPFIVQETLEKLLLNPTSGHQTRWYNTLYQGIRRANAVIERVPPIAMNGTLKNRCLGEARFLRALFYLDLARGFAGGDSVGYGGVPIITTTLPPATADVRQVEAGALYREIIYPDLIFAAQNLETVYGGADLGRATKGAANALLARAALYFKQYQTARDAATAVIEQGPYTLEADFSRAFRVEGNYGSESVFEIGALPFEDGTATGRGGNSYGQVQAVRGNPNRGFGFNRMSMELLRDFEGGDVRREKSILRIGEVIDGITILGSPNTKDVTFDANGDTLEIEIYNEKVWVPGTTTDPSSGHHRRFIRYADVLLMGAEAELELGNTAKAAEYANRVRARARATADVLPDLLAGDPSLREAIRRERRHELALEGSRFYDLVRWGQAEAEMGPLGFKKGKNERLPIPQIEIDITGNKIKQNPGY